MLSLLKEMLDNDIFMIVPYLSFANSKEVIVRGRVIKDGSIITDKDDDLFDNIANSIKRIFTSKGRNLTIKMHLDGADYTSKTDSDGYFEFKAPFLGNVTTEGAIEWIQGALTLPDFEDESGQLITAKVDIMLRHQKSTYGVITDIDDTIIQSHVNSFLKWRLLYVTFLKNANSRMPFEQAPEALRSLACHGGDKHINPLFYISHSPWNLYDLLHRFFHLNGIPDGPIFLRDIGVKRGKALYEFKHHKTLSINRLLSFYKDLPFVMLGDATEHDADIYLNAYYKWPQRIKMIMIRASKDHKRNQHVMDLKKQHPNVPLHLIRHSREITELCQSC